MLISNHRITESVIETLERLQLRRDLPADVAYDLNAAATILRHSQHVELSDGKDMRAYCSEAIRLLQAMKSKAGDRFENGFDKLIESAKNLGDSPLQGNALKQAFDAFLVSTDRQFAHFAVIAPEIAQPLFSEFAPALTRQHNGLALFGNHAVAPREEVSPGEPLTRENLTAYLRDKLSDPSAEATDVTVLPGGFGKETTLFSVTSRTLNADLVMRRDASVNIFGDLDCHIAPREYPLLKAVFAKGFPAPEPMFFETSTPLLKGPSFTIMRRAPGAVEGDATGGEGEIPGPLQRTLAQVTARLHSLPPLDDLAGIPALAPARWRQSASECTRSYIASCYAHFLQAPHLPMPVLHSLYNWLLAHVPAADEPPVLVHGDVGFHNLLFDGERLGALLDWEYSHVGDPAEDLGYIRSLMGKQLDWPAFLAEYGKSGRPVPGEQRIRFFEIWSLVRNSSGSVLVSENYENGRQRNIKYSMTIYRYAPYYMQEAERLIAEYDKP